MQPTLYGISSREQAEPSWLDRLPAKPVHWFLSGEWYRKVEVLEGGPVVLLERDDRHPGYLTLAVRGRRYYVPADAWRDRQALRVRPSDPGTPLRIPGVGPVLGRAEPGDVLWAGVAVAGDHVFVNRVSWNFRRPRRGEVMVFSTDGIRDLPQGTHYIKRLVGLPGERLWIDPPWVFADGRRVEAPETIARVARGERLAPWAPPYAGYQTIGLQQESSHPQALRRPGDTVKLPADGYYAMGDNTLNSRDSRYWGWVPERNLLGPAAFVYWPFFSPRLGPIR
jgi:signal peptidase I